jgi:hypothetical protein
MFNGIELRSNVNGIELDFKLLDPFHYEGVDLTSLFFSTKGIHNTLEFFSKCFMSRH